MAWGVTACASNLRTVPFRSVIFVFFEKVNKSMNKKKKLIGSKSSSSDAKFREALSKKTNKRETNDLEGKPQVNKGRGQRGFGNTKMFRRKSG